MVLESDGDVLLPEERAVLLDRLIRYGVELESQGAAQVGGSFTGRDEADSLLHDDPNAFLLGILFTQGIPAERAWSAPYELKVRLGTLEPRFLVTHSDAVREAVVAYPALHRFKNTLPRWISSAAERLEEEWGGDAARIWASGTHVLEVNERLVRFDGIGRKKSAMAIQILIRHFGVDLSGRDRAQVAYDVHVRRVFLRTGLAKLDNPEAIERVAREGYPRSPGTLDLAAWLIGRRVCRPTAPHCDECLLGSVCPRLVEINPAGVR